MACCDGFRSRISTSARALEDLGCTIRVLLGVRVRYRPPVLVLLALLLLLVDAKLRPEPERVNPCAGFEALAGFVFPPRLRIDMTMPAPRLRFPLSLAPDLGAVLVSSNLATLSRLRTNVERRR